MSRHRWAAVSIVSSTLILGLKWVAYTWTGSAALKSDALEGVVNVVAAVFAMGALAFAEQPADRGHPYGHGKIEYFSAAFEGGLISLAAILIMYEGVRALVMGPSLHDLGPGLALNLGAGALNGLLGWTLVRQGRRLRSEALEADGHHVLSDFLTTVGVAVGLGLVLLTGWVWIDPIVALVVGVMLGRTGIGLVKKSSEALLDAQDPAMIARLVEVTNRVKPVEVIAIHEMRAIRAGRHTHVDVHIVVPEFHPVAQAHDMVERFCATVIREAGVEGEFHSHVDPCVRLYCARCAVEPCPIRTARFVAAPPITAESAVLPGPAEALG